MRRLLLVAVLLAASTVAVASPAYACSVAFPGPSEQELLDRADVAFEGVAGASRDPKAGAPLQTSGDPIFWTFVVDRPIKGAVAPVQEVASPRSSASCGMTFQAGARYLVLARFQDGMLQTHLGSGTRPAPLMPPTTPPARPSPNRQIALTG